MKKDDPFVTNANHKYLHNDQHNSKEYISAANSAIETLRPFFLKPKHWNELEKALQLQSIKFEEEQYLRAACETTVTASLAADYPDGYIYEYEANPQNDTDCDCSFLINEHRVNIEVKCFNFTKDKEISSKPGFKFSTWGDSPETHEKLKEVSLLLNSIEFPITEANHSAQNVRDFLVGTHRKFGDVINTHELNVLVICASDASKMQDVFSYMLGAKGLLTGKGKLTYDQFKNIDVIVVSNLYHRHDNFWKKSHITNHWSLREAFNLCIPTYWCSSEKQKIYKLFLDFFPNNTEEFREYCASSAGNSIIQKLPTGTQPILKYVNEVLTPAGRFYF
jgi:hypothetical protein